MTSAIESLTQELGNLLKQKNWKLSTAESCTGGGLGFYLTSMPGSSEWYEGGFITYSNTAKMEMLNVKSTTLDTYGAVSEFTANEMAEGALEHSHADISVAITGIAGPDGGSEDKPVGMVWMAYAGKNIETITHVDIFPGNRTEIRFNTIARVIEQLVTIIKFS